MPVKDFREDLTEAAGPHQYPHLSCVREGEGDGSICFTFTTPACNTSINFEAIVSGKSLNSLGQGGLAEIGRCL